jgi:8-oxo-dGTP diphosphatase
MTERMPVDVAVGILVERDANGRDHRFLLTSRPPGKVYEGYWEFPGGKLEPGETVEQALRRELQEEIGVTVSDVHRWRIELFDYPHAKVRLHFCKVYEWINAFDMKEGQEMTWQTLPVSVEPVLPATIPVLAWLGEKDQDPDKSPSSASVGPSDGESA